MHIWAIECLVRLFFWPFSKKLKPEKTQTQGFFEKTQGTGGFSLFDPPKKRDKKSLC